MNKTCKTWFRKCLIRANISRHILNHLIGKQHSLLHQRITGASIMMIGVLLVKLCAIINISLVHFMADVVGYGIHGIGLIPFISKLESIGE